MKVVSSQGSSRSNRTQQLVEKMVEMLGREIPRNRRAVKERPTLVQVQEEEKGAAAAVREVVVVAAAAMPVARTRSRKWSGRGRQRRSFGKQRRRRTV
jgi:hypothetical protein